MTTSPRQGRKPPLRGLPLQAPSPAAEQAIQLYERALGAKTEGLQRFGNIPGSQAPPENANRVIHAELHIGKGLLMISDTQPGMPLARGSNVLPRAPRRAVAYMLRSLRALGSFLFVLTLSAASVAQTPSPGFADVSGARDSFEKGMQAYREGRFRAAVEHFADADRLAPSPRLSYNVALAYERMGDGPHALAAYRDYLRRSPQAENAAATSIRIAELELELQVSGVQQLSVLSTPSGATVLIDQVSRGVAPWTGELPPGTHHLVLELEGYERLEQSFELPARHAIDLTPKLRPQARGGSAAPFPTSPPAPADRAGSGPKWWTWAAFGGSAALLLGSGAFELSRRSLEGDIEAGRVSQPDVGERYDAMTGRKTAARVLLVTGVAAGVAGGVSLYFDLREGPGEAALGVACDGSHCEAQARGYW